MNRRIEKFRRHFNQNFDVCNDPNNPFTLCSMGDSLLIRKGPNAALMFHFLSFQVSVNIFNEFSPHRSFTAHLSLCGALQRMELCFQSLYSSKNPQRHCLKEMVKMWLARVFCQVLTSNLRIIEKGVVVSALTTLLAIIHKYYEGLEGQDNFRRVVELCDHVLNDMCMGLSTEETLQALETIEFNTQVDFFDRLDEFKRELRIDNTQ